MWCSSLNGSGTPIIVLVLVVEKGPGYHVQDQDHLGFVGRYCMLHVCGHSGQRTYSIYDTCMCSAWWICTDKS